jgi:hypothetical protein
VLNLILNVSCSAGVSAGCVSAGGVLAGGVEAHPASSNTNIKTRLLPINIIDLFFFILNKPSSY